MPRPQAPRPPKGLSFANYLAALRNKGRKRPRRKGGEPEREPVEPDNPRPLSDGAAAALEFDD